MDEVLIQYNDLLIQKRYSENTIKTYYNYYKDFCVFFENSKLKNVSNAQINTYILTLIQQKKHLNKSAEPENKCDKVLL